MVTKYGEDSSFPGDICYNCRKSMRVNLLIEIIYQPLEMENNQSWKFP